MPLFDHPEFDHHRQVLFGCDPESGLKAIIAIHDTTLAPPWADCASTPMPARRRPSPTCCGSHAA